MKPSDAALSLVSFSIIIFSIINGSILTPIVYKHSEMPYTVFLRAVSSQGRRGHEYSYTFIRQTVGLFLTSSFLTSLSVYVLTLANACNVGRRTFSTCSMHMQLGVTYHIPKGASKNGLPVKETFKMFKTKHFGILILKRENTLLLKRFWF